MMTFDRFLWFLFKVIEVLIEFIQNIIGCLSSHNKVDHPFLSVEYDISQFAKILDDSSRFVILTEKYLSTESYEDLWISEELLDERI